MKYVTCEAWKDFGKERKSRGYETIPFKQFKGSMRASLKNTKIVSPDSKLDIIRVIDNYRVIGKYLDGVFYIIAYNTDFSAYNQFRRNGFKTSREIS